MINAMCPLFCANENIDFVFKFNYYRFRPDFKRMVMKMQTRLILAFIVALVLSAAANSFAAIYKYIDKNGIICFADDLQSIPEPCRATAQKVKSAAEEARTPAMQMQLPAGAEAKKENAESSPDRGKASIENKSASLFSSRALISGIVVVSALFAFVLLGILDAEHKKSTKIIRVVILWGMSVYLIVAHRGDVADLFSTLKGKVDTVQRDSEEKRKKTAKALKDLNALMQDADHAAAQVPGGADPDPEKKD